MAEEIMKINTVEEKIKLYDSKLRYNGATMYLLVSDKGNNKRPIAVVKANMCEDGFGETECHLFSYTYTEGNRQEKQFMMEQGYVLKNGLAYEIQTPLGTWSKNEYLGEIEILTKSEMVNYLLGVEK